MILWNQAASLLLLYDSGLGLPCTQKRVLPRRDGTKRWKGWKPQSFLWIQNFIFPNSFESSFEHASALPDSPLFNRKCVGRSLKPAFVTYMWKPSATSGRKFGQKLSHHVMSKVLILKAQGRHVMWSFLAFFGQSLARKDHITWWMLSAERSLKASSLDSQCVGNHHRSSTPEILPYWKVFCEAPRPKEFKYNKETRDLMQSLSLGSMNVSKQNVPPNILRDVSWVSTERHQGLQRSVARKAILDKAILQTLLHVLFSHADRLRFLCILCCHFATPLCVQQLAA